MADLTVLNTSTSTIDSLSTKYKGFNAPGFSILVNGDDLMKTGLIFSDLTIENSLEKADSFRLTVKNSFDPIAKDFTLLDKYLAIGKKIEIKTGYVDVLDTIFKGYITAIRYELTEKEHAAVVVSGMDYSFKLMKGIKSRVFPKMKDSEVASQLIGEVGLTAKVDSTNVQYDMIQQVGVSNYQFLRWLADRNGFEFFVSGDQVHFRPTPSEGSPVVTLTWGKDLLSLIREDDLVDQTGTVTVRTWDAKTKAALIGEASQVAAVGSGQDGKALLSSLLGTVKDNYFSEARTKEQVLLEAKAIKNRSAMKLVSGEARCIGNPVIRAGRYIQLAGLGTKLNQIYYISATRHSIDDEGYVTTMTIGGNMI